MTDFSHGPWAHPPRKPRKTMNAPILIAGLMLSVAGLIGGHIAAKGVANLAHFNATEIVRGY